MEFTNFIIYGLAVWRVSSLLVHEDGPFLIFRRIRSLVGIKHGEDGFPYIIPSNFLPQIFGCTWCMSLWVGLTFTIFLLISPTLSFYFATAFSFSTIAIMVEAYIKGRQT